MKMTIISDNMVLKLIAIILIAAVYIQDITYANPDMLAASSFFRTGDAEDKADVKYLKDFIESRPEFQVDPSLKVIAGILEDPEISGWMSQNGISFECISSDSGHLSEVLIHLPRVNRLRYYDPALSKKSDSTDILQVEVPSGTKIAQSNGQMGLLLLASAVGVVSNLAGLSHPKIVEFMKWVFCHDRKDKKRAAQRLYRKLLAGGAPSEHVRKIANLIRDREKFAQLKDVIPNGSFEELKKLALEDAANAGSSLDEKEVSDYLDHNVYVLRDVSILPDDVIEALSVLGTFNVPGVELEGSRISGIAVMFYDSMANNISSIRNRKKRAFAIKELWGVALSEFLALKGIKYEDRMDMVSRITGVSRAHIEAFRSRKKLDTVKDARILGASRLGDLMHASVEGPVYYVSDVHGYYRQLPPVLSHIKEKGAVLVDCGDLGSSSDNAPPNEETMKIFFGASGNIELLDCLNKGGEELKKYARRRGIDEKYVQMAESNRYEDQIEFFRRLFDSTPIGNVLAIEGVHTDSKSLLDMYLELHPEVLIFDNMGVAVRHNLAYPALSYSPDPESPGTKAVFELKSMWASLFPPNFDNITVADERSAQALDALFSFRQKGHPAVKLAVVGHCHPEKPLLFQKKEDGPWTAQIISEGREIAVEDHAVLIVPALKDAYKKSYIPYTKEADGKIIVGCDTVDMEPNKKVSMMASFAGLIYKDDYLSLRQEERISRLIGQSWLSIKAFMDDGMTAEAQEMIRKCFVIGMLWENFYHPDDIEIIDFIQDSMRSLIEAQSAAPQAININEMDNVDLAKLVSDFKILLEQRALSLGFKRSKETLHAKDDLAQPSSLYAEAVDTNIVSLIAELRGIARPDINAPIVQSGTRILLSDTLFSLSLADRANLDRLLSNTGIEILPADKIMLTSMAKPSGKDAEAGGRKLVCVLSKDDYDQKGFDSEKFVAQSKARLLVLNGDLKDCRYAYLGGIIGLARAITTEDKDTIKKCMGLIFDKLNGASDDDLVAMLLQDPRGFAENITFKKIERYDTGELPEAYKREAERFLESA